MVEHVTLASLAAEVAAIRADVAKVLAMLEEDRRRRTAANQAIREAIEEDGGQRRTVPQKLHIVP